MTAAAMQDRGCGSVVEERSADDACYDPLRIALRNARDAFDPDRAALEHRAATAPLIWYIDDTPDMVIGKLVADAQARTL